MKGFTLIELLAVIVILAIILLISVPLISDVIKNSKNATLESSAKSIKKAAKDSFMNDQLLGKEIDEVIYIFENGIQRTVPLSASKLEISGEAPKNGYIRVNKETVDLEFNNGENSVEILNDIVTIKETITSINVPISFNCGEDYTDTRDSKIYRTVKIGDQCWFKENVNYTSTGCLTQNWLSGIACRTSVFEGKVVTNYQWNAAMNGSLTERSQGVCPAGFVIPSDNDFKKLERFIGMSEVEIEKTGARGIDEGTKLKAPDQAYLGTAVGTDDFGFSARSSYSIQPVTEHVGLYSAGFYTSTNSNTTEAVSRGLSFAQATVARGNLPKDYGYQIRCLKK